MKSCFGHESRSTLFLQGVEFEIPRRFPCDDGSQEIRRILEKSEHPAWIRTQTFPKGLRSSCTTIFIWRICFVSFFLLLVTKMEKYWRVSLRGATVYVAKHDRDVVNSDDPLYATRKLLPLLSLSHEQKIERRTLCTKHSAESGALTICVKYTISCEIHDTFSVQFLRELGSRQLSTLSYLPSPLSCTCGYVELTIEIFRFYKPVRQFAIVELPIKRYKIDTQNIISLSQYKIFFRHFAFMSLLAFI